MIVCVKHIQIIGGLLSRKLVCLSPFVSVTLCLHKEWPFAHLLPASHLMASMFFWLFPCPICPAFQFLPASVLAWLRSITVDVCHFGDALSSDLIARLVTPHIVTPHLISNVFFACSRQAEESEMRCRPSSEARVTPSHPYTQTNTHTHTVPQAHPLPPPTAPSC